MTEEEKIKLAIGMMDEAYQDLKNARWPELVRMATDRILLYHSSIMAFEDTIAAEQRRLQKNARERERRARNKD